MYIIDAEKNSWWSFYKYEYKLVSVFAMEIVKENITPEFGKVGEFVNLIAKCKINPCGPVSLN